MKVHKVRRDGASRFRDFRCRIRTFGFLWILLGCLSTLGRLVAGTEDFVYSTNNNGSIVIGGYTGTGGTVIIPESIHGLPVTELSVFAFSRNSNLTSLILPKGLVSIGVWACSRCPNLTNIFIPSTVNAIGSGALTFCTRLTSIDVDAQSPYYTSIDGVLFKMGMKELQVYPAGRAGSYVIPDGVQQIEDSAFDSAIHLTSVTIPESVIRVGDDPFFDCTHLTEILVHPLNLKYASMDGVLFNKERTFLMTYPAGKEGSYVIPDSVTDLSDYAFNECHQLTRVTFTAGMDGFGEENFDMCSRLMEFQVSPLNPELTAIDGVLFSKDQSRLIRYPNGKAGDYVIPAGVNRIELVAFAECINLTRVEIPGTVTNIGVSAFRNCTGLTDVSIPNGITDIHSATFMGCARLSQIKLPVALTMIGGNAFADCSSLTNITLPGGITSIFGCAFLNCTSLTEIVLPDGIQSIEDKLLMGCTNLSSVHLPPGIEEIGFNAFAGCRNLKSLTIPGSVRYLHRFAFDDCSELTWVHFKGDAPLIALPLFENALKATVVYRQGTVGWGAEFGGRPTLLWNPEVSTGGSGVGVVNGQFGFTITGSNRLTLVVERCTELRLPIWSPVATLSLQGGSAEFRDPTGMEHPSSYYRLVPP